MLFTLIYKSFLGEVPSPLTPLLLVARLLIESQLQALQAQSAIFKHSQPSSSTVSHLQAQSAIFKHSQPSSSTFSKGVKGDSMSP